LVAVSRKGFIFAADDTAGLTHGGAVGGSVQGAVVPESANAAMVGAYDMLAWAGASLVAATTPCAHLRCNLHRSRQALVSFVAAPPPLNLLLFICIPRTCLTASYIYLGIAK